MGSLSIREPPGLATLPTDVFYILISYLDTARSVTRLAATCRGLYELISECGWRIFVISRFPTFRVLNVDSPDEWKNRARSLICQARDWDRRAFAVDALVPPGKRRRGFDRHHATQSIPGNVIVDAHHWRTGAVAQDLVFWGAGEDIFALIRHTRTEAEADEWLGKKGASVGYRSGKDDVTCVSILKDSRYNCSQGDNPQVLVGRANGHLRLLSMDPQSFGRTLLHFRPTKTPANDIILQKQIQSFDVNYSQGLLAAATKENIIAYPLTPHQQTTFDGPGDENVSHMGEAPYIASSQAISLKDSVDPSCDFEFIRSVKFTDPETLAIALNKSYNPLQHLRFTPTGIVRVAAAKMSTADYDAGSAKPRTVRALLPLDTSSVVGRGGSALLSSWDDGTIRLQDLRTPSPYDRLYQDNFDISTPINALLSRGLERFVAGSAYAPVLKVFDYRWHKGYYHTDSLPCGNDRPYPTPRPPTIISEPPFPENRAPCDHIGGRPCRWHALSRLDYYRPNFNMWLLPPAGDSSPVYSVASPADDSPTLFVGLSGTLMEITAKSSPWPVFRNNVWPARDLSYLRQAGSTSFIETGDGAYLSDVAQSRRVPPMHRQVFRDLSNDSPVRAAWRRRSRLDEWVQDNPGEEDYDELHQRMSRELVVQPLA
ncbi:hypothetical protein GGS23DRAFT_594485 [Durotheca rogersii]|uniref:uncharacterized protein n=1 Tax=Durotheca rogersii TaxID=419775 RepID=UPI00221EDAC4|nr:uncharacterized protein GGS23DRAFT_594485 [Durotheca rogersii]KAI5866362.1 hypothetical protein GGS23DRAFT_594485 [Durotheca rogersii]